MDAALVEHYIALATGFGKVPNTGSALASSDNLLQLRDVIKRYPDDISLEVLISELDRIRRNHEGVFTGRIRTAQSSAYHDSVRTAIGMAQDFFKSQM